MNALAPLNVPQPIKLRVSDFLLLDAAGVYDGWRKTELIEGEVVGMNAQHRPHSHAKTQLAFRLQCVLDAVRPDLSVIVEGTVELGENNAPEPDITVTSEPLGDGAVPLASVALIVEVSDSTLGFDMREKAAIYARHGVPEYWVVDLTGARVVRHWHPAGDEFAAIDQIKLGDPIEAVTLNGVAVATDGLTRGS